MKKRLLNFIKFIPLFFTAGVILSFTMNKAYWDLNWISRVILALPIILMFFYLLKLLDLFYFSFNREKYAVVKKLRTINLCEKSILNNRILLIREFYIIDSSLNNKIFSLININGIRKEPETVLVYKSPFYGRDRVFDWGLMIVDLFKLIAFCCVYFILKSILS